MKDVLKEARTILQTTPLRWIQLSQNLSGNVLNLPPAPGEWSAVDCLRHLVDTERWVFPVRIKALRAGQDFAAFDPDSQGTKSDNPPLPAELAAEFAALRTDSLALFDQLTTADLTRQARHQELGLVTLSELVQNGRDTI